MNNFFVVAVIAWLYFSMSAISKKYSITQWQKKHYEDTLFTFALFLIALLFVEAIIYYILTENNILNSVFAIVIILLLNAILVFVFRDKEEDKNNKLILANQASNFENLKIRKVVKFKKIIKKETDIDLNYYHLKSVHKSNDMTVDHVKFNRVTMIEFKYFKSLMQNFNFRHHAVYKELIKYYNRYAEAYRLEVINYAEFMKEFEHKKRFEAEKYIVNLFEKLVDRKIPIRIAQLLQYSNNRRYLSNFIYYLMCLESKRFVSNSIMYLILFYDLEVKKREKKNEQK